MTADEARAALVDYLRSHGHGKFVDDCIADLVQAAKAEALRDAADAVDQLVGNDDLGAPGQWLRDRATWEEA